MTPHRLLITGAAGEVGTALRELLPRFMAHTESHAAESEITEQRQGGVFVDSGYVGRARK